MRVQRGVSRNGPAAAGLFVAFWIKGGVEVVAEQLIVCCRRQITEEKAFWRGIFIRHQGARYLRFPLWPLRTQALARGSDRIQGRVVQANYM